MDVNTYLYMKTLSTSGTFHLIVKKEDLIN